MRQRGGADTAAHHSGFLRCEEYALSHDFLLGKNVWRQNVSPTKKTCADKKNVHRRAPSSTFMAARKFRGARFWQKFARRPTFFLGEAFARLVHFCTSAHILGRFLAGVARNRATGKRTPSNRARYTGNHDFSKSRAPTHRCTVRPEIMARQNVRRDIGRREIAHRPTGTLTC